ncbi:hypothetical protein E4U28_006712 [Claviceps purpurea]|nr:hypothetical protein E4U28_006712 [Claviceps purpurea]
MNALHDKCRPKHQVLVLKCYPKTTKGAVDVVPNSSELSYLLFYATSRRSKIQKIGSFLEKKTASDVWRMRIGNVQVTLGILAALVEKSPKEAALIAPCVLKILDLILRSDDITMVESSLPTFEAFCQHHDASSLFGDSAYLQGYSSVVRSYAQLASTRHVPSKGPVSKPLQFRWRNAGLKAIKHVAGSDALSSVSGRQIDVIVPMILENAWTDDDDFLDTILQSAQLGGNKRDSEKIHPRRSSVNTVRTAEVTGDTNPVAFSGTALDVDNLAEEETGVFAIQCLKQIFVVPNRAQIYGATNALLKFVSSRVAEGETVVITENSAGHGRDSGWAIKIFDTVARWTPVQDRYVILLATLDVLTKTPMREENLQQHLTITAMMQSLLRSDVNLIGLSVMDVLLGLVGQIKKLFQLRRGSSHEGSQSEDRADVEQHENGCRLQRDDLLARLEDCTSDLANHVYYADQVSDMIAALFSRIKHSRSVSIASLTHGGDKAEAAGVDHAVPPSAFDMAGGQSLHETYFSHASGRLSALKIVKAILLLASPKTGHNGHLDLSRTRVPIQVWEGTQWLLRDPDGNVRKAYVDALSTWLDRELTYTDMRASDDTVEIHRTAKHGRDISNGSRRAVSNTSGRERQPRARRCQFLPLLHVAIYDSALEFVEYDNDITLLHSLLTKLVFKLGVNAARCGIPMVYRLQEDIQELEQPIHKVRIASLTHGYFWALAAEFDFEGSVVGRAVYKEIVRRKNKGFWVEGVHVPAPAPAQIGTPGQPRPRPTWDLSSLESEEILPFDDRPSLVECIATSYQETNLSPPTSPTATSPSRNLNGPMSGYIDGGRRQLPAEFKEHMLSNWTRESVLAAITAAGKAESLTGSKAGTTGTTQHRLAMKSGGAGSAIIHGGNGHFPLSSRTSQPNLRPHTSHTYGERQATVSRLRKSSVCGRQSPSGSVSSKTGVASIAQLKMMLSGNPSPQTAGTLPEDDDSDESMLSCDYSLSDIGLHASQPQSQAADAPSTTGDVLARNTLSGSQHHDEHPSLDPRREIRHEDTDVPPVPPLPNLTSFTSKMGLSAMDFSTSAGMSKRPVQSRGGDSLASQSTRFGGGGGEESGRGMNLQDLLRGIDSRSGEGSLGGFTKPPY